IWNQSKFNQRLESVADTKCQSVSFIQKLHNRLFDLRILECGCKEFRGAVRLITCGKSTREHDDLCFTDSFFKDFHRIADILCRQVLEDSGDHLRAGTFKRSCTVILTVGSRKYRNKYGRLCQLM